MTDTPHESDGMVGYKRPPKHSRFKPGQSGNPRGRPKGSKSLPTLVRQALGRKVKLTDRGQTKQVTVLEALLRRLVEVGLVKGELRAIEKLLTLGEVYAEPEASDERQLAPSDEAIIARFAQSLLGPEEKGESR